MITFRTATPGDIPLIRSLAHTIWHHAFPAIITREQIDIMLSKMYDPDTVRREMAGDVVWKLLMEDETPIGYVSYSMVGPGECKIHKVYVLPDHHGQGLGRRCLAEAVDFARSRHAVKVLLMVNRANHKALRAYRAFGFREAASLDWEFAPGLILNDYRMELELTSPSARPTPRTG